MKGTADDLRKEIAELEELATAPFGLDMGAEMTLLETRMKNAVAEILESKRRELALIEQSSNGNRKYE